MVRLRRGYLEFGGVSAPALCGTTDAREMSARGVVTRSNDKQFMPLFELADLRISEVERTTFEELAIRERYDLQLSLRKSIHVIDAGLYVIEEEFGDWEDARRRIDLLCLDREGPGCSGTQTHR